MKQWMPENQRWTDCGPSRRSPDLEPGTVLITKPGGAKTYRTPYSPTELRTIIKRGEEDPRPLPPTEQTLANRNRVIAEGDAVAFERWARDGCLVPEGDR